jgi:20S proteasome alpha/beta subunit
MSLLVGAKAPNGIVLAADSRLTVTSGQEPTYFDRAEKVWVLMPPNQHVAIGFYGKAAISLRNAASLIEEFGRLTR